MSLDLVSIKSISKQIRGVSYSPNDVNSEASDTHVKLLRANNVTENGINLSDVLFVNRKCVSEQQVLRKGDILIVASSGSKKIVGRAILIEDDINCTFGAFCKVIRPTSKVNYSYLSYFFRSSDYRQRISHLSAGANINNLKNDDLDDLQIPLPPLPIQKRIAEILDAADALRRKDQELLKKYDELAQAIFLDIFGDPVKNERGWELKKIGDSIDFLTSGSRGWAKYYSKDGDLFLRINNVGYNSMRLEDKIFVKAPENAESKRTCVRERDILLSITADLGRTCVIPENFPRAYINQHLALIRLKSGFNSDFVSSVLATDLGRNQFNKLNKGGVKAGLNFEDIKSIEFINPPVDLQNRYSNLIRDIRALYDFSKNTLDISENLFNSLIQKAFKGDLVS